MGRKKLVGSEFSQDGRGNFQRDLGWKGEQGKYKQHRFYLGKDPLEASVRAAKLEQVWAAVEKRWARNGRETPRPAWDDITLQIGMAVSRGEAVCKVDLDDWAGAPDLVLALRRLQGDFSMVRLVLADEEEQRQGEAALESQAQELMEEARTLIKRNTSQPLLAALSAFGDHLRQHYTEHDRLSLTGQVAAKDITRIKEHIADLPLCNLDNDALEAWIAHWVKRPLTKRKTPAAPKTCMNTIKRIRMFIRWLHKSKQWDWQRPADYEQMPVKIKATASELERRAAGDQVGTYTDAELVTPWKHAKPKERLYMLLALNTGAGITEIASLQTNEIRLDQSHRKYGVPGNWIMRIRLKTSVYGEWKLWDQTADAIRWYMEVRPKSGETALVLTERGEPVVDQTTGGNRAQTIPNTWGRLTARVRKLEDKDFRKLSFNKLRKTAINAIRDIAGSETAGVFGCHGKPVPTDGLLDLYSNRDFRRVHDACVKWGERLAAMFAAVPEPFVAAKRRHQKPDAILQKRQQAVDLRGQGKTLAQISEEMGLSIGAVRNHLAKASEPAAATPHPTLATGERQLMGEVGKPWRLGRWGQQD